MKTNSQTMQKIGKKIWLLRKDKHISQEKLAELSDLNRNFIGMVERGETNITVNKLEKIANALDIEIKVLFDFTI